MSEFKFTNQAIKAISANPELDPTISEVIYRVSTCIDDDLNTLKLMTNGSGFQGVDPAASVYRSVIQNLQLFNNLFDNHKLIKALFDDMWTAIYEYKSKV